MALTARISSNSDEIIHELAARTGKSKIEIIEAALEDYRFKEKMRLLNDEYERLKLNNLAWQQELEERIEIEGTVSDGLEGW